MDRRPKVDASLPSREARVPPQLPGWSGDAVRIRPGRAHPDAYRFAANHRHSAPGAGAAADRSDPPPIAEPSPPGPPFGGEGGSARPFQYHEPFDESRTVAINDRALRLGAGTAPDCVFQPGEIVLVGRDDECSVSVENQLVSRRHLEFRFVQGGWWATDLQTSRGTFIDGNRIKAPTQVRGAFSIWMGEQGAGGELRVVTAGKHEVPRKRLPLVLASLAVVVAVGATLLALKPWGEDPTPKALPDPDQYVASVPRIESSCDDPQGGSSGTGTVIGKNLVLTNFHVVAVDHEAVPKDGIDCVNEKLTVYSGTDTERDDSEALTAEVLAVDPDLDLAVIRVAGLDAPVIELADSRRAKTGQSIRIMGYPGLGSRQSLTVTDGIISGLIEEGTKYSRSGNNFLPMGEWLKTDAVITHGNSGGAAFDTDGRLLGVPTWGLDDGAVTLSFLRPVHLAEPLIASAPTADVIPFGDPRLDAKRQLESISRSFPDPGGDDTNTTVTGGGEASLRLTEVRGTVGDKEVVAGPTLPSGVTKLTFVLQVAQAGAGSVISCTITGPDDAKASCTPGSVEAGEAESTFTGDFPDGAYHAEYRMDGVVAETDFEIGG